MSFLSQVVLVLKNKWYSSLFVILLLIFTYLYQRFTDFALVLGNHWEIYFTVDVILSVINIIFFPLLIVGWLYRSFTLGWGISTAKEKGTWFLWLLWWIISVIISWSLCCWTSILLVFWAWSLSSLFSQYFFFWWLELKALWVVILIYATISLYKDLLTCKLDLKKKKKELNK